MLVSINTAVFSNEVNSGSSQFSCLKELVNKPIDNIEVRGEFFDDKTKDDELNKIDNLCQQNNWNFFYSIPEELFQTNKINNNLVEYLKMADKHNISHLKISMGDSSNITDNQLIDLTKLLNQFKVNVTIENQPNENGTIDNFTRELSKLQDAKVPLGYTFDSGNWYWIYECPSNAFSVFSNDITIFHLKDIKDKETVMLDTGATDWKNMLLNLSDEIPIFLEYEISPQHLDEQIQQVNEVLSNRADKS